jgi:hypothetical protein
MQRKQRKISITHSIGQKFDQKKKNK